MDTIYLLRKKQNIMYWKNLFFVNKEMVKKILDLDFLNKKIELLSINIIIQERKMNLILRMDIEFYVENVSYSTKVENINMNLSFHEFFKIDL